MTRPLRIHRQHSLLGHNTLAIPAIAEAWAEISGEDDLQAAIRLAREHSWPILPLGGGSNLVLGDRVPGLVLSVEMHGIGVEERPDGKVRLRCAAGENWHDMVTYAVDCGYYGAENLALIPGSVGAAPIQNIGAYGVELEEILVSLTAVNLRSGEPRNFRREDCRFSYRDSIFKHELRDQYCITEVCLELSTQPKARADYPVLVQYLRAHDLRETPENIYAAVCEIRRQRLPLPAEVPNAGSFFKNPLVSPARAEAILQQHPELPHWPQQDGRIKLAAAALIDLLGWKGRMREGVGVHENHALVLINPGRQSASTLLAFAAEIQLSVRQAFGLELEIEPRCYPD